MKQYYLKSVSQNQIDRSLQFAKDVIETNKDEYARRNQKNTDKVLRDIYYGKIAEFSVWNEMRERGISQAEPDLEIYTAKQKSFDADLNPSGYHLHVKSSLIGTSYSNSWTFQPWDKLVSKPKQNDLLALCSIEKNGSGIVYYERATKLVDKYEPPLLARLNKKCLYFNSIKDLLE